MSHHDTHHDEHADDAEHEHGGEHDASQQPGTTHAAPGSGNPEIIIAVPDRPDLRPDPDRFPLDKDEVTIGSGPDQDIRLPDTEPHHLTIFHDERDEYRVRPVGLVGGGSAAEPNERALRTGATLEVGPWVLTFRRDESADHGRPFGGRQGGEFSDNPVQPPRPADQGDQPAPPVGEEQRDDQQPAPDRQQ